MFGKMNAFINIGMLLLLSSFVFVEALGESGDLPSLLENRGVLARYGANGELKEITMQSQACDDRNMAILSSVSSIESLACMIDSASQITTNGIDRICSMTNLVSLSFASFQALPDGFIRRVSNMKQLRTLKLGCSDPPESEYKYIGNLTNLTELIMYSTNCTGENLAYILGKLVRLQKIVICSTQITSNQCTNLKLPASLTNMVIGSPEWSTNYARKKE